MSDEPTAIRHPKRGKAHRSYWKIEVSAPDGTVLSSEPCARCDRYKTLEQRGLTERVPLSQTAPEDRCRTCWPTPKETL